jgi:plastocyanin
MRKLLFASVPMAAAVAAFASFASGQEAAPTYKLSATLTAGQTIPHAKGALPGATGHFTATLANGKLKWRLTFAHLTGRATAAHIHVGVKGKSGAVLVPLCAPCKTGATGTAKVPRPAQFGLTKKGATYVNVHTVKNPAGEIRGQLVSAASTGTAGIKVAVALKDYSFSFSRQSVPAGSTVIFTITNVGSTAHNLDVASLNKRTAILPAGGHATLTVAFTKAGSYQVVCDVPRHIQLGMVAAFKVT